MKMKYMNMKNIQMINNNINIVLKNILGFLISNSSISYSSPSTCHALDDSFDNSPFLKSFWVNSNSYNIIESVHMTWLLSIVDSIIGTSVYEPN